MRCNIICTGDSLRGYDFDKIQGYRIGVNFAYMYLEVDETVIFDDPRNFTKNIVNPQYLKPFGGQWTPEGRALNLKPGYVSNVNVSLFMAINIAIHRGFTDLHIYGADNRVDKCLHFYDNQEISEQRRLKENKHFAKVIDTFEEWYDSLLPYDLTFYDSDIDMFNNAKLV